MPGFAATSTRSPTRPSSRTRIGESSIVDPARGDTLYSRNAGKLFMPASNMKILTSATALDAARPGLSLPHVVSRARDDRRRHVDRRPARHRPRRSVGQRPHDARRDDPAARHRRLDRRTRHPPHHRPRRRRTATRFPAKCSATAGRTTISRTPTRRRSTSCCSTKGSASCTCAAATRPATPVRVEVRPARSPCRASRNMRRDRRGEPRHRRARAERDTLRARKDSTTWDVVLEGQIGVRDSATIEVTHHDPDAAYVAAVARGARREGDHDRSRAGRTRRRASTRSRRSRRRRSSEILKALMKPSQNQIAEMLFRTVALERRSRPRDSARAVVERQIASWGVAVPSEAVVRDGSGLARYDYISPRTVVRILDAMRTVADLPGLLRRAADRRRRRHDSQSHEGHARRGQRPREDRLGRASRDRCPAT